MARSMRLSTAALAGAAWLVVVNGAAGEVIDVKLSGYEEVPAISSSAKGALRVNLRASSITYRLSYSNLGSNVIQAHIHFAQKGVNGGISAFLCSNVGNGPVGTPACPGTTTGVVTGTISATGIVGPIGQNIAAGQLNKLKQAIRAGIGYVNVHTVGFPGGEIRGQIIAVD